MTPPNTDQEDGEETTSEDDDEEDEIDEKSEDDNGGDVDHEPEERDLDSVDEENLNEAIQRIRSALLEGRFIRDNPMNQKLVLMLLCQ